MGIFRKWRGRGVASPAPPENLRDLYMKDMRSLTDEELDRVKRAPDDELIRMSASAHYGPGAEAMRRLRETIAGEERAIRRLTR